MKKMEKKKKKNCILLPNGFVNVSVYWFIDEQRWHDSSSPEIKIRHAL